METVYSPPLWISSSIVPRNRALLRLNVAPSGSLRVIFEYLQHLPHPFHVQVFRKVHPLLESRLADEPAMLGAKADLDTRHRSDDAQELHRGRKRTCEKCPRCCSRNPPSLPEIIYTRFFGSADNLSKARSASADGRAIDGVLTIGVRVPYNHISVSTGGCPIKKNLHHNRTRIASFPFLVLPSRIAPSTLLLANMASSAPALAHPSILATSSRALQPMYATYESSRLYKVLLGARLSRWGT